ncbi:MAG: 6-phosphogluconate dehydrogenase, partial [Parcubacteria group bacterium Gr01-1014_72]
VARLLKKRHRVVAWNRSEAPRKEAEQLAPAAVSSLAELAGGLPAPRTVWLMVSHGAVDAVLDELLPHLSAGDTVIDGGNSFYKDSIRRAKRLGAAGVHFLDVGVSGGPAGARNGACLMIGGERAIFEKHEPLFRDLSAEILVRQHSNILQNVGMLSKERGGETAYAYAYAYLGESGAGHFAKMVHNGIEYGMMQSLAEGMAVLKASPFHFDLNEVARIYNNRSVIESRLVGWLQSGLQKHETDLKDISPTVAHTGEGQWTVEAAKELGVSVPIIEASLQFRKDSATHRSFIGKILSLLRGEFGGHEVGEK